VEDVDFMYVCVSFEYGVLMVELFVVDVVLFLGSVMIEVWLV